MSYNVNGRDKKQAKGLEPGAEKAERPEGDIMGVIASKAVRNRG
jgi:hypothetical protein